MNWSKYWPWVLGVVTGVAIHPINEYLMAHGHDQWLGVGLFFFVGLVTWALYLED